jgi:hypothetical protein
LLTCTILLVVIVPAVSKPEEEDYKVMALPDEATTYTGQPILVNVLQNDYHKDGKTALVLAGITSDGAHGKCTVVGDIVTTSVSSISYKPDYGYSGYDECGYKVCAADDYSECNFSTLSVVIAKQLDAEFNAVSTPTNDRPPVDGSEVPLADVVDPEDLLSEEVWKEVEQSVGPAIVDGMWKSSIEFDLDFCSSGDEVLFTVELQTDEHGGDVSWELRKVITSTTLQRIKKGGFYTRYSYDRVDVCVQPGMYTFIILDEYGDGMCDHEAGMCGFYKLYLDGREVVNVSFYGKSNNHRINVGYDPTPAMTTRDAEYLLAHNERRRKWHEMHNVPYVPLLWSPKLAEDSSKWAVALLDACNSDDIEHEQGVLEGENLAKNKGYEFENGSPSWGQLYPPESKFILYVLSHEFQSSYSSHQLLLL